MYNIGKTGLAPYLGKSGASVMLSATTRGLPGRRRDEESEVSNKSKAVVG